MRAPSDTNDSQRPIAGQQPGGDRASAPARQGPGPLAPDAVGTSVRQVLDALPDAFYVLDPDWCFTYLNGEAERLLGRGSDELLGSDFREAFPEATESRLFREYGSAIAEGRTIHFESTHPPLPNVFEVTASPTAHGLAVYFRDITGRLEAERRIRYQADLLDAVDQAVMATDLDGTIRYWNRCAERLYGWTADEAIGRNVLLTTPAGGGHADAEAIMERVRRGKSWRGEFLVRRKDGSEFPALVTDSPIYDHAGRMVGIVGVSIDLSERNRQRAELERRERRFRSLIENTVDVITVLDEDGTIVYESPSIQRLTGYTPEDLVGRNAFDLIHPEDADRVREAFEAVLEQPGTTLRIEFRALHKRGDWRLLEGIGKNLLDDPAVRGVVYNGRDITERKRTEEAQRFLSEVGHIVAGSLEQRNTLQAIADLAVPWLADLCLIDLTEEGGGRPWRSAVAFRGPEAEAWLDEARTSPPSAKDELFAEVIRTGRPRLLSRTGGAWKRALDRSPSYLRRLEPVHPRSIIVVPITARNQTYGVLTLASTDPLRRYTPADRDLAVEVGRRAALSIENARLYEAALIANEARTEFLALISHELRTPLNTIMGYADLLHAELSGPLTLKQRNHLARVQASARRLLQLIDEILTYTRMETGRDRIGSERIDLQQLVRRAADLVEPVAIERGLKFSVRLPAETISLVTDAPRVHQALLHVMTNAIRFTERGGITVEAAVAGDFVRIRIRDTGIGISCRHLELIFDPFWQVEETSTRRAGGAGLGLSIARRLMRSIGGDITVESEPGRGSTFTISVPVRSGPPGTPEP